MIYGSVCSGIEAATVAWHGLGFRPSFFSEIDKFPRAVLAHHYPSVPLHGDFTSIECERLQGFPDNYTLLGSKTADGSRYKALGNSMAVPVMRWLGERIAMVEGRIKA